MTSLFEEVEKVSFSPERATGLFASIKEIFQKRKNKPLWSK
jgi:hypothetical protein